MSATLDFLPSASFADDGSIDQRTQRLIDLICQHKRANDSPKLREILTRSCDAVRYNYHETAMAYMDGLAQSYHLPRQVIQGCTNTPLLYRWKLLVDSGLSIYMHCFTRSDEDRELHDHPFSFVSLILKNGYTEVRPIEAVREQLGKGDKRVNLDDPAMQERVFYEAGSLIWRPSWWAHRVEIQDAAPSWSLVIRTPKTDDWGFFTKDGWTLWSKWHAAKICDEGDDTK